MNDRTPLGAVKRAAAVRVAPATREVRAQAIPAGEALASTKPVNDDPATRRAADDQVRRADARVSTKPANDDPRLALAAHDRVTPDRVDPAAPVQATISPDALRRDSSGDRRAS